MKTLDQLYEEIGEAFDSLKRDPKRIVQVDGLVNAAGKMVAICKVQSDYAIARGEMPEIPAMGKTSGKPLPAISRKLLKAG